MREKVETIKKYQTSGFQKVVIVEEKSVYRISKRWNLVILSSIEKFYPLILRYNGNIESFFSTGSCIILHCFSNCFFKKGFFSRQPCFSIVKTQLIAITDYRSLQFLQFRMFSIIKADFYHLLRIAMPIISKKVVMWILSS